MRKLLFGIGCCLLSACSGNGGGSHGAAKPVADSLDYARYLASLNPGDPASMTKAAERYTPVFGQASAAARDSGYALFQSFYDRADSALNARMEEDSLDYEPIVNAEIRGIPGGISPAVKAKADQLRANGFRFTSSEGMAYIEKDLAWVGPRFYRYLSPEMKEYVERLRTESDNRFADDAAILLSPRDFVDRAAWWEDFTRRYPRFALRAEAERMRKLYLTTLLEGMDNTSVLDYESNGLSSYYDEAWRYLANRYPQSAAAALVVPVHQAWTRSDTAAAGALLRRYRGEGRLYNYEEDTTE